jgi:hypothetical protein
MVHSPLDEKEKSTKSLLSFLCFFRDSRKINRIEQEKLECHEWFGFLSKDVAWCIIGAVHTITHSRNTRHTHTDTHTHKEGYSRGITQHDLGGGGGRGMEGGRCKKQHTNTRAREITILLFFSCLKKSNETLNCYRLYLYLWPRYVLLTLFSPFHDG